MININKQSTEYEIGTKLQFNTEPGITEQAIGLVMNGISKAVEQTKLEAKMIAYDALHGTHYRQVRHALAAEKRNRSFEAGIGLLRIS